MCNHKLIHHYRDTCISYLCMVFQYRYFYILNHIGQSLIENFKWFIKDTNIIKIVLYDW